MSIVRPFQKARVTLGVPADADAAAIKRAYRKLTLAHPPDTDPDGFRRVRDAYELLTDPWSRARDMLLHPQPAIDPPPLPAPAEPASAGDLPLLLLRRAAGRIDAASLLEPAGGSHAAPPETTERTPVS